jgi:protein O-mannosyl-transferase
MQRTSQPRTDTPQRTEAYCAWAVCGLLLLMVGLVYGQTRNFVLLDYDDNAFVYECPQVRAGLTADGIKWALFSGPQGEWYPLAMISHMLDCQLFGLDAGGHHLTNVLLHGAAAVALFLVLWRMTGELWPSAFVAAVFAVHPQHVESVAWVAERRDVLSGLFFVLALGAYLGYVRHGRQAGRYVVVAAMLALSLMAKPMAVTLPPLLLLLDYWPLGRWGAACEVPRNEAAVDRPGTWWLVLEKLPLLAIALGACLITLITHNKGVSPITWSMRLSNAPVACASYVEQLFYPVDLAVFYPYPAAGQPLWKVTGALAILAAISAAVVVGRRRYPYGFVGWFWFLGMLVPVLGVVQVSAHAMADRYMYLPGIGLSIALTWGLARLGAGSAEGRWALGCGAALVIAVLASCAAWQTSYWRDDETLWRHSLASTEDNSEAEVGLGDALNRQGRIEPAVAHYRRAVKFGSEAGAYNNLGSALAQQAKLDEAIAQFESALRIDPDSARAHANLGRTLARQSRYGPAEEHLRRALAIDPNMASAHFDLAHLLLLQGNQPEAATHFERAVALDPDDLAARNDLALTLIGLGKTEQAIGQLQAALKINPKFVAGRINLARALAAINHVDDARSQCRQVLAIEPGNPAAQQILDQLRDAVSQPSSP